MRQADRGRSAAGRRSWRRAVQRGAGGARRRGARSLAELSWQEAEKALTPASVVVMPLGVATVQHGPHLKLNNNERLARYLGARVQAAVIRVVVAPPLTYHFYPTFLEYPGSTSISSNTARDMTVDIVRSLAKYGPRRFYVLNTGVTTMFPLKDAAEALADHGILLGYTDIALSPGQRPSAPAADANERRRARRRSRDVDHAVRRSVGSGHARRPVREYGPGSGPMTRQKDAPGTFSASGVVGDPTVATREKGQAYVEALLAGALEDIEAIRTARLPVAKGTAPAPAPAPVRPPPPAAPGDERLPSGCTAGEERAIRAVGERYSYSVAPDGCGRDLARMFTADGDMRHPDGTIERTAEVIFQNRVELFRRREYRGSVHPVQLNDIRCLAGGTAIADGKWELRLDDPGPSGTTAQGGIATRAGATQASARSS